MTKIRAFDWGAAFPDAIAAGGFDCIVGNPPYIRMETFKELKPYLKSNFACHDERSDLYAYFVERGHKMLKAGGRCGMIISNKFLRANYGRPLREFLRESASIDRVVDFAGLPVFQGATVRTVVLLTSRSPKTQDEVLYSPPMSPDVFESVSGGSVLVENAISNATYQVPANSLRGEAWSFGRREAVDLTEKLHRGSMSLGEYCHGQVCMGVKSGLAAAFVIDGPTRASILDRNPQAGDIIRPFLNGRDVRRYNIEPRDLYLIYTHHGVDLSRFQAVKEHLQPYRTRLEKRATKQAWYELQQPQFAYAKYMEGPKIIFPDIAAAPRFALDDTGFFCANTTYFIPQRDLYLLGLLNSRLGAYYFARACAGLEGKTETYLRFFGQYMELFPVHQLDLSRGTDATTHDRMVGLVDSMLSLSRLLSVADSTMQRDVIQRQILAADAEIDHLVYEMYGLTDTDIDLVEGQQ
jgi:hypothetical protein